MSSQPPSGPFAGGLRAADVTPPRSGSNGSNVGRWGGPDQRHEKTQGLGLRNLLCVILGQRRKTAANMSFPVDVYVPGSK